MEGYCRRVEAVQLRVQAFRGLQLSVPDVRGGTKGKLLLRDILDKAQVYREEEEYHHIARVMSKEEIHPEVCRVLDMMADRLGRA